ncbi:hypothetical protein EV363DRAFT_1540282 [Boletus edulis]|nr:hypothetical protein EV363DRAFT_1540282 [Boletus edulis]
MSADVQSFLALLQLNNYASLMVVTAVVYDYCLTISKEVAYIWTRPWTRVSTLFLLIRYVGCISAITFVQGSVKVRPSSPISLYVLYIWTYAIFLIAADMAMILRVYAMYNRSKFILGILLLIYIPEVVIVIVGFGIYSDPNHTMVSVYHILDITGCGIVVSTRKWGITIAIIQFVRDSLKMYQATRKWQMNRYISLLTRDGLFYYLAILFNSAIYLLYNSLSSIRQGPGILLATAFAYVFLYTLTPRFVMNIRELYVLDTQGRGDIHIDTGFGLSSRVGRDIGGSTTIGTIAFAEVGATSRWEDAEETATDEESTGEKRYTAEARRPRTRNVSSFLSIPKFYLDYKRIGAGHIGIHSTRGFGKRLGYRFAW